MISCISNQERSKRVICYAVIGANFQHKYVFIVFEGSFRLEPDARAKDTVRPSGNLVKTRKSFGNFGYSQNKRSEIHDNSYCAI